MQDLERQWLKIQSCAKGSACKVSLNSTTINFVVIEKVAIYKGG